MKQLDWEEYSNDVLGATTRHEFPHDTDIKTTVFDMFCMIDTSREKLNVTLTINANDNGSDYATSHHYDKRDLFIFDEIFPRQYWPRQIYAGKEYEENRTPDPVLQAWVDSKFKSFVSDDNIEGI